MATRLCTFQGALRERARRVGQRRVIDRYGARLPPSAGAIAALLAAARARGRVELPEWRPPPEEATAAGSS